jgi:hypothetical protein
MRSLLALPIIALSTVLQAQSLDSVPSKCHRSEYFRFAISDGDKARGAFFARVPCKYLANVEKSFNELLKQSEGTHELGLQFFRFQGNDQPGSHTFKTMEYMGEGTLLDFRSLVVKVSQEKLDEFDKDAQLPIEKRVRYGWVVFKKGKTQPEAIVKLKDDGQALEAYLDANGLVMGFPEQRAF